MPSGFQQNINQLQPSFYRVVLDLSGYPTADGNDNGGITPNSSDSFAELPTTLALGQARARGNMRFRNIINRLSNIADCQILDIEINEADADSQAAALAFTVKFDRNAGILDSVKNLVGSPYYVYGSANTEITTTILALRDQIIRAITDSTNSLIKVAYGSNPNDTDTQQMISVVAPDTAANVFDDVSVALIDGTELITDDNIAPPE